MQVMIPDEVLDAIDLERHANGDAERADGQQLDDALEAQRSAGTEAFERRQADHLRAVEKEMARTALAGVDDELRDRLAEQFPHGLPDHFVGDVEGVDINHLAL